MARELTDAALFGVADVQNSEKLVFQFSNEKNCTVKLMELLGFIIRITGF